METSEFKDLAFVALGSNLGDSPGILRQAMTRLQSFSSRPLLKSSFWQTTPVDCPAGSGLFVNAVAGLAPHKGDTPEHLLASLLSVEKEFGRQPKTVRNEARPLDLDLIAFGDKVRFTGKLILPHPRAHRRRFVLEPMAEIAPDFVWPELGRTVRDLLAALDNDEQVRRLGGSSAV